MSRDPSISAHQFPRKATAGRWMTCRPSGVTNEAVLGLAALLDGNVMSARAALSRCSFTIVQDTDPVTGHAFFLASSGSPDAGLGGFFLLDRSRAPSLMVSIPQLHRDRACVDLGLRLWRALPGTLLVLAAAPRLGRAGRADPIGDTDPLLQAAWARLSGRQVIAQVQIEGFAGRPPRGPADWAAWGHTDDVKVSVGSAGLTLPALRIAEHIAETGQDTRCDWDGAAPAGHPNAQSLLAGRHHWPWVSLAVGPMVRSTPSRWQAVADAIAEADPATYRLVSLGTAEGPIELDTSSGDHFLITLTSDATIRLSGTPTDRPQILLHLQALHGPHCQASFLLPT